MRPDLHLQKAVGDKIINRDVFDYASIVGSLLYLSLTCRPVASTEAAKQIIHYRLFLRELGRKQDGPSILFETTRLLSLWQNPLS